GMWENIAKKFNGLGLSSISMVCGMFALWLGDLKVAIAKCALYLLMLNAIAYASPIKCLSFEGLFNEVSRND
ncbi:DUF3693 domain-containing protein, partial [Vibrio parahaemolyticus]|uniref:DUF3693 domain-containing protein n=1 Tax=Vibrio parahaemolyticus TaxID=670 RepID=UPI00387B11AD